MRRIIHSTNALNLHDRPQHRTLKYSVVRQRAFSPYDFCGVLKLGMYSVLSFQIPWGSNKKGEEKMDTRKRSSFTFSNLIVVIISLGIVCLIAVAVLGVIRDVVVTTFFDNSAYQSFIDTQEVMQSVPAKDGHVTVYYMQNGDKFTGSFKLVSGTPVPWNYPGGVDIYVVNKLDQKIQLTIPDTEDVWFTLDGVNFTGGRESLITLSTNARCGFRLLSEQTVTFRLVP